MSYRSLSVNVCSPSRLLSNNQKPDKFVKKLKNKNSHNKIPEFKCKKSFSTNHYPPKSDTQRHVKESKVKESHSHHVDGHKLENLIQRNLKNSKITKKTVEQPDYVKLAMKILKVKKSVKVQAESSKLERLRQKLVEFFEVSNQKLETQTKMLKSLLNKKYGQQKQQKSVVIDIKKPMPSINIDSQKIQHPFPFQQNKVGKRQLVTNQLKETKRFPSLRMLKKVGQNEDEKPQRRKRMNSCRFVINPFRNGEFLGKKRNEQFKFEQENKNEGTKGGIWSNQISQIEKLGKGEESQIDSANVSILGLMNW